MALSGKFLRGVSQVSRAFSTSAAWKNKVAVLGAAGGIGQPLSLLLKVNHPPNLERLALYDIVHTPGVGADLSHIASPVQVTAHVGKDQLADALKDAKVVVIPAGVPRKPGMTRDDLFNTNAGIVRDLAAAAAKTCPDAMLCIITNPVNSMVPIASEVYKKAGVYNPRRIFGVTTLDVVRAKMFIAEAKGLSPYQVAVPVVGGHAGETILPLLSQLSPGCVSFGEEEIKSMTSRIQNAGTEVVNAKDGAGSATLSMAFAGAQFASHVFNATEQKSDIVTYSYIKTDGPYGPYFSMPIQLGPMGVEKVFDLGPLSSYEKECIDKNVLPQLKASIAKGEKFVA